MPSAFTPLSVASRAQSSSSGTIASALNSTTNPAGTSFRPFSTASAAVVGAVGATSGGAAKACSPIPATVKVHREGDQITRIQVQCSCGQVMDLDCVY